LELAINDFRLFHRFVESIAKQELSAQKAGPLIVLPEGSENISGIWLFLSAYEKDGYSGNEYFGNRKICFFLRNKFSNNICFLIEKHLSLN